MKQLKYIQGNIKEPKFNTVKNHQSRLSHQAAAECSLGKVKSSPSNKSGQISINIAKTSLTNSRKKQSADIKIKKGDMAEFLKRKELLKQMKSTGDSTEDVRSTESSTRLRDIGCQTVETNLAQKLEESTKLTMLYPKKDEDEAKLKASGDSAHHRSPCRSPNLATPRRAGDALQDFERPRSRLNAILERKVPDNKDPFLPSSTFQIIYLKITSYTMNSKDTYYFDVL